MMSSFARFTALQGKNVTPSNSDNVGSNKPVFPFLRLPAELREAIYLFAIQPITPPLDTAAIPGTPDRVHIPAVAQASSKLREEALHVLFRNRPVEFSLHSAENLRRALLWTEKCSGHTTSFGVIIFSGCLKHVENLFYHITLQCADYAPYFRVRTRPGASSKADILITQIKDKLLKFLDQKVKEAKKGQEGRLSGGLISEMIIMICAAACVPPPTEPPMQLQMNVIS
jgi:hypothetical protein